MTALDVGVAGSSTALEIVAGASARIKMATKANPFGGNNLEPASVRKQLITSLGRLQVSFY